MFRTCWSDLKPLLGVRWTDCPIVCPFCVCLITVMNHLLWGSRPYSSFCVHQADMMFPHEGTVHATMKFHQPDISTRPPQINNPYMENLVKNQENVCVIILLKQSFPRDKKARTSVHTPTVFHRSYTSLSERKPTIAQVICDCLQWANTSWDFPQTPGLESGSNKDTVVTVDKHCQVNIWPNC